MTWLQPAWLGLFCGLALLFGTARKTWSRAAFMRALTLGLLICALAQPVFMRAETTAVRVLLVDSSPSLAPGGPAAVSALADAIEQRTQEPLVRIEVPKSHIGAALHMAAAQIPAGQAGSVTLISDGLATDVGWRQAAAALAERQIPVHAIQAAPDPAPRIGRATPREPLRSGASAQLEVELANTPPDFELAIYTGDFELARTTNQTQLHFEVPPSLSGFSRFRLQLTAAEGNSSLEVAFPIAPPKRALYLGQRVQGAQAQLARLIGPGFELEGTAPSALTPELLRAADLVILDDLSAESLGTQAAANLAEAVKQDGLGLFATGSMDAFGPGGWHDTPIEALLPVELIQSQAKRDPSTTLVVIIDTSGSMGGNRVQLAKEVARLAMRRLLPQDKVGIVEFFGAKRWAAPIQSASNSIEIERALNRLSAAGGTVILPAIEEAYYALKNVNTRHKHVVILTDGGVESGAFEPLLRALADDGVNVSTVLIGDKTHSEFLVSLANWGKGRFYSVPNRFSLPDLLLKQPTTTKLPALRPGPHPLHTRGGPKWWGSADEPQLPDLDAYVETRLRPGAAALIETRTEAHPILATWSWGLGRVTSLTCAVAGPGSASWDDAEFLGPLLARVFEHTARHDAEYDLSIERHAASLTVVIEGLHGLPGWGQESGPSFDAVAPRRVATRLSADTSKLNIPSAHGSLQAALPARFAPELNAPLARQVDLQSLTRATGGDLASHTRQPLRSTFGRAVGGAQDPQRVLRLWPLLLALALLNYLVEVLWRRLTPQAAP